MSRNVADGIAGYILNTSHESQEKKNHDDNAGGNKRHLPIIMITLLLANFDFYPSFPIFYSPLKIAWIMKVEKQASCTNIHRNFLKNFLLLCMLKRFWPCLKFCLMVSFSRGMMHRVSRVAISWRIREIIFQWAKGLFFLAFKDCSEKDCWCQRLDLLHANLFRKNNHKCFRK